MRLSTATLQILMASIALIGTAVRADKMVLSDLESKSPKKLSKDQTTELMTGAKVSRVTDLGNTVIWTNDAGGSFIVSSSGGTEVARAVTAKGKWNISDEGRYCVLI